MMANYDLHSAASISASAAAARVKANAEPNQNSYNAGWLHGYAEALRDVSNQLRDVADSEDADCMVLIRDNIKVEWEAIGEGVSGAYNSNDPLDIEFLRFYVSVLENGNWREKEDASYCTQFPADASDLEKRLGLEILMEHFYEALHDDPKVSVKKLGEKLSWISLTWIADKLPS